jgi:hypothetical protein
MDDEEVERESGERSDDQLSVCGIDEMTSGSGHNSVMDVMDVEENVNEVSMDEVSVGCDPESEDYGSLRLGGTGKHRTLGRLQSRRNARIGPVAACAGAGLGG